MYIETMARFHKSDIARLQLETAVRIFLRGLDRSSAITLAGAASEILDALVRRAGKEPFVDYARRIYHAQIGHTPKRKSYSHHIAKHIGVIDHKHLSEYDSNTVELDLGKMAFDSLSRAMADYITLYGQDEPFVKAFLSWSWQHLDGPGMMKHYENLPSRMRPKR